MLQSKKKITIRLAAYILENKSGFIKQNTLTERSSFMDCADYIFKKKKTFICL